MAEKKRKILLVEDDMFIRDIYNTKFLQEGFEVVMADNGIEALKRLEENIPDVILLDIMMPQMDGKETLGHIKEKEQWKEIPIIMLTNVSEKENLSDDMEKQIQGYLIKSQFTPSEVVEKVEALLR